MLRKIRKTAEENSTKGISPFRVAEKIYKALTAKQPKSRYLAGKNMLLRHLALKVISKNILEKIILHLTGLSKTPINYPLSSS